jgi:DeoR/GlpR family transcriptional regulator of sugar metabolism
MTEVDLQEAILKKKMIETVDAVYALIDASKFGKVDLTSFAGVERITQLYTESRLSEDWINRLLLAGIHFTLCEDER